MKSEDLSGALGALAFVEVETPQDFAERVLLALDARSRERRRTLRVAVLRVRTDLWRRGREGTQRAGEWLDARGGVGRSALAGSAIVIGAVAIGLETRHLLRSREVTSA
jgi:hypothetical protein